MHNLYFINYIFILNIILKINIKLYTYMQGSTFITIRNVEHYKSGLTSLIINQANSSRWWRTAKPGVLQPIGS